MLTQSKEVQNAWRASQRTLDIKVTIDGKVYGATDINSLKYDSGAYNGDTFAIGSTYSNTVQIEFSHLIEGLKLGMEVHPSIGIKTSSGYVYEPLGVFIISSEIKMDRNNNLTTVSASDRFCGLEGTYVSKLTYPAKVLDVIAEICAQSGVKANTDDLARLPHQADLPAPITGQSYRKALGWIAQLYVGYALFDRQGLFTIRTISEPNYELDPSQYEQAGLTKNEAAYKINGIQCQVTLTTKTRDGESTEETKTYQAGDATGSQIKLENNIMAPQRLNDIWEQLKDLTFYPFSLNWFGNPAVEAGDWLRLEDKQGNSFVVPNSSYTLDFNGGLSATSKADQTTSSDQMVPWQGSVAQTIKELKIRRSPDGTVVFPPSVTAPPTNAKFNDVWFKKNGNSTELWIFEKQDDGSGKWIRKDLSDDEIKKKVADAQQGLNQAKADIINNKQKADADIESLNKSIEANKKVADESLQKLNDSVTNLQGQYDNNVVPNLNKVMADASDALQKYISAQNSIADLTKQAQQQGKDIADVSNTVKGLNINYANLAGDVNSTKVDVKGLQTTVGTANGDIAQLKLDAQNLQTMLAGKVDNTTYTNFVNLTNQALNARLTASDLNGYAKTVDVQATANGLRVDLNSVTDRVNNLKVGGRNLIPNSGTDIVIESKTTDPYPAWDNKAVYWDLTPGETYTFSASATNTNGVKEASIRIWNSAVNKEAPGNLVFPADGRRHSTTFTIPKDGVSYSVWLYAGHMGKLEGKNFATTYHHPMLQIGNAGTEWSPNPQDIQNDLSQLSARITTTNQQFSSYYTKSETDNKTNSAKNDVINIIRNDGKWQGLSNILTNSGFLQTADGFLQKVQQTTIPMFNGGGVNLLKGTADFRPDNLWQPLNAWVRTNETYNGLTIFKGKTTEDWNGLCQYYPVKSGETYTFSLNARYESGTGRSAFYIRLNSSQEGQYKAADTTPWSLDINLNENWQRYSITFKASSDGYIKPRIERGDKNKNILEICGFKLEQGSVATPWSPNPADVATQSAFSELSQSLEGLRSTVGSNYGELQTQISQSASGIRTDLTNKITGLQTQLTTTADGLNAKFGAIQVGGRNLLRNSNKDVNVTSHTTDAWPAWCNYNTGFTFEHGQTYTFSVEARSSTSKIPEASIRIFESSTNTQGAFRAFPADGKRHSVTFTIPNDSHNYQLFYYAGHAGQVPGVDVTTTYHHPKLERGTLATDWSPAPEDTDQAFTEINATISGLQSTVSNNHGELQSQISQTAKNIRQEVSDKTSGLQTQITQQSNNFNVSLNKIQQTDGVNILRGTRDFSGDWDQLNNWYKDGWVDPNGNYAIKRKGAWGGAAQRRWLDVGTYTFSVYYWFEGSDSSTGAWVYVIPNNDKTLKITENSSSSLETTKDKWIKKVYTFTVTTPGTSAVRVETNSNTATIHVGSYKLEKGYKETPWTNSPYDIYMNPNVVTKVLTSVQDLNNLTFEGNYVIKATNNTNSPIGNWLVVRVEGSGDRLHQTISADNDPNLSYTRTFNGLWSAWQRTVTGGNIMAQINMSAGTTLIRNDKIYMDASSTIFSGNAFIPSAAITSLNADKITAGTINGAKVNVINLNANNITAGTLRGSNGEFYLDSGALHVWQNNHDAWIDQNGIHDYDNQRSVWIQKGEINFEHQLGGSMKHTGVILTNSENSNLNGAITIKGDEGFLLSTKNFTTNYWSEQGFSWGTNTAHYVSGSGILGFNNNITVSAGSTDDHSIAALIAGAIPSKNLGNVFGARAQPGVYIYGRNDSNKDHSFVDIKAPASIHLTTLDSYITIGDTTGSERNSDVSINSGNYLTVSADNSINITACSKTKADLMPRISLSEASTSISGDSITLNAKNYVTLLGSSVSVTGDFGVLGKKNAIVPTSRGMAAINAYETAEYYFGDIGETQTNSNGVVTVMIDPYFLETVNTLVPYQVFLTSYGDGNVWVSSRSANNFTVKSSNPNIHFAWEIKAKRKGYENDRMKIVKGVFNNEQY